MDTLLRSLNVQASLSHPGCLPIRSIFMPKNEGDKLIITTPFMENRSLHEVLKNNPDGWNATKKSVTIFGIAANMAYVHSKNVIHRDLKPSNVLLDENFEPHIADFYLSRFLVTDNTMTIAIGTPLFMAPELYSDGDGRYDEKVDVYAYAILLYQMFTDITVHTALDNGSTVRRPQHLMREVLRGARFVRDPAIPERIWNLITRCWAGDPKNRPSFEDITQELLDNLDWAIDGTVIEELVEYQRRITNPQ